QVAPEKAPKISAQELKMSATLVQQYSGDFTPQDFEDDYQNQLQALIEAKIEQGEDLDTEATFGAGESEEGSGDVIDLMEALKRSIGGRKEKSASKPGKPGQSEKPAAKKPAAKKKTAAKKPAAKASAKKKPAAKKKSAKEASSSPSKKKASGSGKKSA